MTTPCPQSVIDVGGASVLLRHHFKDIDRQTDYAKTSALIQSFRDKLEATKPEMQAAGMRQMAYGTAYVKLAELESIIAKYRAAEGLVMEIHHHLAGEVDRIGMATPTDAEIAKATGVLNFR